VIKNGWLDRSRTTYLSDSPQERYITLSPLSSQYGISMVVAPIDNPQCPSKVFVVELAQPMNGATNEHPREGVLVYSVDSTVPTGHSPIVVHPKTVSVNPEEGYLYEAAYGVGDAASVVDGNSRLTATVLQQFGSSYHLKLSYTRQ